MNKIKIFLISILYIPACFIGTFIGTLPKYLIEFINPLAGREPDWYSYYHFIEPVIIGVAGGVVSGFVINALTVKNKSLFLIISFPILWTAFVLYAKYFANNFQLISKSDDWIYLTISMVSLLAYLYFVFVNVQNKKRGSN